MNGSGPGPAFRNEMSGRVCATAGFSSREDKNDVLVEAFRPDALSSGTSPAALPGSPVPIVPSSNTSRVRAAVWHGAAADEHLAAECPGNVDCRRALRADIVHEIRVGTCGYSWYDPGDDWDERYESKLAAYADAFDVLELNQTFYSLPQVSTAKRWRREAVDPFSFVVKAWQALTHPWGSPTWNGHRDDVPDDRTDEVGHLKPSSFVETAWERTKARADALAADLVLIQTPPSFGCTDEHERNLRSFFDRIDRGELAIAWEPRGDWPANRDRIEQLCTELDLIHAVDPMRADPTVREPYAYARLHGLNDDPTDYDYDYSRDELLDLVDRLQAFQTGSDRVYCLFNNYEMYDNATALKDLLAATDSSPHAGI